MVLTQVLNREVLTTSPQIINDKDHSKTTLGKSVGLSKHVKLHVSAKIMEKIKIGK